MQTDDIVWLWDKSKRRKNIAITVNHDRDVIVKTPMRTSIKTIESFLRLKRNWIDKQKVRQETRISPILPKFSLQGELYFLGEKVPFIFKESSRAKIIEHTSLLKIYAKNEKVFERILLDWYREKSQSYIEMFLAKYEHLISKKVSSVTYKKLKRRWGSCDNKNHLIFNKMLSVLPIEHIEYVVVHELAHIKHKHHQKAFWEHGEELLEHFRFFHKAML